MPGFGYCETCKPKADARRAEYDKTRPSAARRLYDRDWRKARAKYLAENPWCVDCAAAGEQVKASEVDHDTPHKGDKRIFWDRSNWRSRCKPHHSSKTATRDSYFARPGHKRTA